MRTWGTHLFSKQQRLWNPPAPSQANIQKIIYFGPTWRSVGVIRNRLKDCCFVGLLYMRLMYWSETDKYMLVFRNMKHTWLFTWSNDYIWRMTCQITRLDRRARTPFWVFSTRTAQLSEKAKTSLTRDPNWPEGGGWGRNKQKCYRHTLFRHSQGSGAWGEWGRNKH